MTALPLSQSMVRSEGIEPIVTAVKGRCLSRLTTTPCKNLYSASKQMRRGGEVRRRSRKRRHNRCWRCQSRRCRCCRQDRNDCCCQNKENAPTSSKRSHLCSSPSSCLPCNMRTAFLLQKRSRWWKQTKIRRGLPIADSPRGLFIEVGRRKNSELPLHRRYIPSALLSRKFVSVRSNHPFRESFLP